MNILAMDLDSYRELGQSEVVHKQSTALPLGDQTKLQKWERRSESPGFFHHICQKPGPCL